MSPKGPAALVLGLAESGYGLVRSLAREGVSIVGVYSDALEFGRLSRFCRSYFLDLATLEDDQICQTIRDLSPSQNGKPVIFASGDYHAALLAKHKDTLSDHFLFHWVSPEDLSHIIDKYRIGQACGHLGIPVPRTHLPQPGEELAEFARSFSYPCLVKPIRSFQCSFPFQWKNLVAHSLRELLDLYTTHPGLEGSTIWQEIIEGGDENIFQCNTLVRSDGEIGDFLCVRKLRQYIPGFGSMAFGRNEENEFVASVTFKLLRFLRYRGLASLEFKYQPKDGRYYFIEMNPRMPAYNILIADAGINLPYLAYLDLIGKTDEPIVPKRPPKTVYWIRFDADLRWFLQTRKVRPINLLQWLLSVATARSYAWWSWRDPMPFCRSMLNLLDLLNVGVKKLITVLTKNRNATRH